jgi:hypothetical protein
MKKEKWIVLCFALLTLIVSISSIAFPWWRAYTSRKTEISSQQSIRVDYTLTGSVFGSKTDARQNISTTVNLSLSKLNATEENKQALQSFFNNTLIIVICGLVFSALTFAFICLSILRTFPLGKYSKYLTILAGIFFLISVFYFASYAPAYISKIDNVTPQEIYKLEGPKIGAFFGSTELMVYGPSLGWYLAFAAFLLNLSLYNLIRRLEKIP